MDKLVTFFDSVQRTIIGELISETEYDIKVKNPLVVNIVSTADVNGNPNGGMALQLMPVYFRELIKNKEDEIIVSYNRSLISLVEFKEGFDDRLVTQYLNTNGGSKMNNAAAASPVENNIVKLFDE